MKIGIVGCAGRMDRMLGITALETVGADLSGGTEKIDELDRFSANFPLPSTWSRV